jgi:hypothetical protein
MTRQRNSNESILVRVDANNECRPSYSSAAEWIPNKATEHRGGFMTFAITRSNYRAWLIVSLLIVLGLGSPTVAQTRSFTYQGKLADSGSPANTSYDMQFKLFDTATVGGGSQQGGTLTLAAVQVTDGIFTVQLDFGAGAFTGADRFLEIAVKPAGGPAFTTLAPRQQVSSTPYAIRSLNATSADGLSVACVNCITSSQIQNVQGSQITGTVPIGSIPAGNGNYIQNSTTQQEPANFNIAGGGTANSFNAVVNYQIAGNPMLSIKGSNNIFAGVNAGAAITSGSQNAFIGAGAGELNSTGSDNTFIGGGAGHNNTGDQNSFVGRLTGFNTTTGTGNSFFGFVAGQSNTTGSGNTFIGQSAGRQNIDGFNNTFVGISAGANNTAAKNTFVGSQAGLSNTSGDSNAFFGAGAGNANTTASNNSFFGQNAGFKNTVGNNNTFIGTNAGFNSSLAIGNTFLGSSAGQSNLSGGNNTFLGFNAGNTNLGSSNTYVGANAKGLALISNASAVGDNAFAGQSNSLILGSINGINGAIADTDVGIGTTTPSARLDISVNSSHILLGDAGCGAFAGIGFGSALGGCTNFSMVGNGTDTIINRPSGGIIALREANVTQLRIAAGGAVTVTNTLAVGLLDNGGSVQLCRNQLNNAIGFCGSSLRYKKDFQAFTRGLDLISRLKPITFRWKSDNTSDLGFGAEDVADVEPLLVTHNEKGEIEGVKYDRISAALVNAVKELQEQIAAQQKQLEELKSLKDENAKLKVQIAEILARLTHLSMINKLKDY